ncbi:LysR family transcriptional regulator [Noviherbaspirillum saxi]|uniref:LysR family transcriptional regulator n=1 Tax=Noviherbaspirillum saxi TaxID=2320863 RepID=A0A3A3FL12_9BURK|nr:LysR family transcriptional regulator [Noviherbaspirillum saxi]RJF92202.1 LysR family transcriptional regulator [Noviherbaspirillum saxi]
MDGITDLSFFAILVKSGSLAAAAQELGVTPSSVSKRLAGLETRLRVRLLNRTTRRISLTPEGELYLTEGERIISDLDALEQRISGSADTPKGLLKVSATLGFGRRHIMPVISTFARKYPDVEVQMHLSDRPVNMAEHGFDIAIRFGELPDTRMTARKLANNRRFICASHSYISQHGIPAHPKELSKHECIFIRESDETYGTWHFRYKDRQETVKVRGQLSTNDGESALGWALDGHGLIIRSEWDVAAYLRSGRLRRLLEEWEVPPADIYVVYPTKHNLSAKTRAFVEYMLESFARYRDSGREKNQSMW